MTNAAPPDDREPLLLETLAPAVANDWKPANPAHRSPGASAIAELAFAVVAALAVVAPAFAVQTLSSGPTLAICGVGAVGLGVSIWRTWALAATVILGALYLAFGAALLHEALSLALALLSLAAAGGAAIGLRRPTPAATRFDWRPVQTRAPSVVIAISGILAALVWLAVSQSPMAALAGPAWVSLMFVALAAASVRGRIAAPQALAAAILGVLLGVVGYLRARFPEAPISSFYAIALALAVGVAIAASLARPHRASRALVAGFGAAGSALLFVIAAFSRTEWHSFWAWAPLASGALLLFGGANAAAREANAPDSDRAVDAWTLCGAALLLIAVESAAPALLRPAIDAAIAYGFARAAVWRGWRGLRLAALGSGLVAVISAASLAGLANAAALIGLAAPAVLLWLAARTPRLDPQLRDHVGAVATLSTALALVVWLNWRMHALRFDGLTASGLYAIALIGLGLVVQPREASGPLARWRTPALIGAGLASALIGGGVIANPWWGAAPAPVEGGAIVNTMLLCFGFPALLAGWASQRVTAPKWTRGAIALAAALLVLLWAALEIRHAFHGARMEAPAAGAIEGALYALLLLGVSVLALQADSRWRGAGIALGWTGLAVSAHLLWSATTRGEPLAPAALLHLLAACTAMLLARRAQALRRTGALDVVACVAALAFAWSAGHILIAWAGQPLFAPIWPLGLVLLAWRQREAIGVRATASAAIYLVWPALGVAAFGLWAALNPWWGSAPVSTATPYAALGLLSYAAGSWLSVASRETYRARAAPWLRRLGLATGIVHAWIGATLLVRRFFHTEMTADEIFAAEALAIACAWALIGVVAFWFGMRRGGSAIARWLGIAALAGAALYALVTAATRFEGAARAWLLVALIAAIAATLWFAATYRPRRVSFLTRR